MAGALFLVDNLLDPTIYPNHTIAGQEEATGAEALRVSGGRRHARDHWTPTTANAERYLEVDCDRPRAANCLIIDRENNLQAETFDLRVSDDDWTTKTGIVATHTVPSDTYYASKLETGVMIKTFEAAHVMKFDLHVGSYWRFNIDAMGAGLLPKISGLWLGLAYEPDKNPTWPWDDETRQLAFDQSVSPSLWWASTRKAVARTAEPTFRIQGEPEWSRARWHMELYWSGYPMWYVPDTDMAERAFLAVAPPGTYGAPIPPGRTKRNLTVSLVEHQPVPN